MATMERDSGSNAAPLPPTVDVRTEIVGATGVVTLDKPKAMNALSIAMRREVRKAFPKWSRDPQVYAVIIQSGNARAFCAGGDIRELAQTVRADPAAARLVNDEDYSLNWLLECFSKPTVSLIDGVVMGSGVGLSQFGTHRVAGERYRFAMPETIIGYFPDCGACHPLARLPDEVGTYLALTGRQIGRADAYALGLVSHCMPAERFEAVRSGLGQADPVDPLLERLHEDPGKGELDELRPALARWFAGDRVEEMIARLEAETGPHAAFAKETAALLLTRSPTSLKVTLRHLRLARTEDLRAVLMREYQLGAHFLDGSDFPEGVRALLVDRDNKPAWKPARLADVTEAMVDVYFKPHPAGELKLPTRAEMQAARV